MNQRMIAKMLFFWMLLLSFSSFGHDYHFAFMEMEYNSEHKEFQASIKFSEHDLTYIICQKNDINSSFSKIMQVDSLRSQVFHLILTGFTLKIEEKEIHFSIEAFDGVQNGDALFYLKSEEIKWKSPIEMQFNFLFDYFPDQQNKMDFIQNGTHHSYSFINAHEFISIPYLKK